MTMIHKKNNEGTRAVAIYGYDAKDENIGQIRDKIYKVRQGHWQGVVRVRSPDSGNVS